MQGESSHHSRHCERYDTWLAWIPWSPLVLLIITVKHHDSTDMTYLYLVHYQPHVVSAQIKDHYMLRHGRQKSSCFRKIPTDVMLKHPDDSIDDLIIWRSGQWEPWIKHVHMLLQVQRRGGHVERPIFHDHILRSLTGSSVWPFPMTDYCRQPRWSPLDSGSGSPKKPWPSSSPWFIIVNTSGRVGRSFLFQRARIV